MPEFAYVNGTILPIEQAVIPVEDRGYQFGDAVYEVVASYDGRLFCLEEHLQRLQRSMQQLDFPVLSIDGVRQAVETLFQRSEMDRAAVYIQISRGVATRNHALPADPSPQVIMTVRPVGEIPPELRAGGASAITVKDERWGRCDLKTVQLLANCLAKQKALDDGATDAIFVNADDVVTEATSSNVFIAEGDGLLTHPLDTHILPGITRAVIIDVCAEIGIPVSQRRFSSARLFGASEVFLTGTVTEVLPIVTVDSRTIGDGVVGPMARKLHQGLQSKIRHT